MCGLCRCQGCDFCQGYAGEPCDSGIVGDASSEGCAPGVCSKAKAESHCQMCRCRGCAFCVAMTSPPPPAAAGEQCVLAPGSTPAYGDTPFPACQQFCSPAKAGEHCALCKCQACSFCKEMAKPCATNHVADTAVEECDGWCHTLATNGNTELACSFCRCAKCSFCPRTSPFGGPYRRDATPRTVDHHVADAGCAGDGAGGGRNGVGAEFIAYKATENEDRAGYRWYDIAVRLGAWRAGAHVKLDFSGGPKVHLDTGSLKGAALSKQEGAGRVFTFELVAEKGGPPTPSTHLAAFTFRMGLLHATLSAEGPLLSCDRLPPAAAPRPSPPPPPFHPFVISPPALSPPPFARYRHTDDFCVLGGQLRINKVWAGGYSFEAHLTMAVWRPGADVILDFAKGRADGADYSNIGLTHASNAQVLPRPHKGAVGVRLGAEPDESYGAIVIGGGAKVHDAPVVTCGRVAGVAPPPPRPVARVEPSCAPLGVMYSVIDRWGAGFKAAVAVRTDVESLGGKFAPNAVQGIREERDVVLICCCEGQNGGSYIIPGAVSLVELWMRRVEGEPLFDDFKHGIVVTERRWLERQRHTYPYSHWRTYESREDYSLKEFIATRDKAQHSVLPERFAKKGS